MGLTDLPVIKGTSSTGKFLVALSLVIFIFFFTQDKETDK